jgi:hypothetical protein
MLRLNIVSVIAKRSTLLRLPCGFSANNFGPRAYSSSRPIGAAIKSI